MFYEWNENRSYYEDKYIESGMDYYKNEARDRLSRITHPDTVDDMSELLSYCWFEDLPSSINIANKLNLRKIHFLALIEHKELFKDEYIKEKEDECSYDF